jgi:hypothetical protein
MSFDPGAERLHSLRTAIINLAASPCRTWRLRVTPKVSTMDLLVLRETDELSAGGSSGGLCGQGDRGAALRSRKTSRRLPTRGLA